MKRLRFKPSQIILHLILILMCLLIILPFLWVFSTSLRVPTDSYQFPPNFLPTAFVYQNYIDVFEAFPFAMFVLNSIIVAVCSVTLNTFITTLAAFSFARINFKYKNIIFLFFLAGVMIPSQAKLISEFIVMSQVGLVGTIFALILPASISPISIFFVRQYMLTIPNSYEEAATIDGASKFQIYSQIFVPMSLSVIIMTSMLAFLASWNNFMGALIYLSRWESMTLPVGLTMLQGYMGAGSISVIFAGVIMSVIIPTLLYIFGQRYILQGSALSGLKS